MPAVGPDQSVIDLRSVYKSFPSVAGTYTALKGINITVRAGEFVAIIGKSGSGKSTLLNMITGIDRPTSGEVFVDGVGVHSLDEAKLARWRGRRLGIVFQFFQLLPTLSLLENVMLPMDFCGTYPRQERPERAMALLSQVGMQAHAHKFPSAISGGQQQRVAIARSLANDPPLLVTDEPTGNLDSKMAESIFTLFEALVEQGKTVVMVTHDNDFAQRAKRSIIIADGEVINEYIASALGTLDLDQLTMAAAGLEPRGYAPGQIVVRQGDAADHFYIITRGEAEVLLAHPGGNDILVNRLHAGQYFGEIALVRRVPRTATVRAGAAEGLDVMVLNGDAFRSLLQESEPTRDAIDSAIRQRLQNAALSPMEVESIRTRMTGSAQPE
jgi:putative ABC transport system ATP-binding protein